MEEVELVWGAGLLSWHVSAEDLLHPLIVARVELVFDRDQGRLQVIPTAAMPEIVEEIFLGLAHPALEEFYRIVREFRTSPFAPWHRTYLATLIRQVVNSLGAQARVVEEVPRPGPDAQVSGDDLLILRKRRVGFGRDIDQWIALTEADEASVPATVRGIVGAHGDQATPGPVPSPAPDVWGSTAEALLLPLPANPEQEEIARRLACHPGVVVQGPPGTGKSHTIANLVCHLLAHGKTVLITSQTERALKVLRDKVPESIRSLCVSVIGSDVDAQEELKRSVQRIVEETGGSKARHARATAEAREQLSRVRRQLGEFWAELGRASQVERTQANIGERAWTPMQIGQYLSEREAADGWIPDRVAAATAWPLPDAEIEELFSLLDRLAPDQLAQATADLPILTELQSPSEFEHAVAERGRLSAALAEAPQAWQQWAPPEFSSCEELAQRLDDLRLSFTRATEDLLAFQTSWAQVIRTQVSRDPGRRRWWEEFHARLVERHDGILAIRARIGHRVIRVSLDGGPRERESAVEALKAHVAGGGGFGPLFRVLRGRLKRTRDACQIDDAPPSTVADLEAILDAVRAERLRGELGQLIESDLVPLGAPKVAGLGLVPEDEADQVIGPLARLLTWQEETWERLRGDLRAIGCDLRPSGKPPRAMSSVQAVTIEERGDQLETAKVALQLVETLASRLALMVLDEARTESATRLTEGARQPAAASVWAELGDALARDAPSGWAAAHQRTRELWRVRPEAERLSQLLARVRAVAPRWAASLLEHAGRPGHHPSPANLRGAWLWSQLAHWLEAYLAARTPEALRREIDQLRHAEAMLIERHVAAATWANLQVRPEERQALVGWQQTISKIGKGTSSRAPALRRQAQERMNAARRAVPVWIMPLARVIENFSPSGPPFDVVIVDESSQSDTFGLLALLRAERAIIVGDDNQISPAAVGQKLAIVDQLIVQHLDGIPNRHLYDGQQSLYDLATAAFGGVIRLREHFRCVPDIISFSNALSYSGEIQPLRDAASTELLPPVILHRVPGFRAAGADTNEVEAEEIAALVAACCEHPAYKDATLGAISLLGEAQAHAVYERVRHLVSVEELDRRQFVAGDAYHFQGDERDIMFLSLVEAPGAHKPAVLNRRPDQQRFNVAASRARDQMWIVHSIDAAAFHPEDMRGRLLTHFAAGDRQDRNWREVDEILQDPERYYFQRLVARRIIDRGYRLRAEVRVGQYRIDLVVDGDADSLAVECDGERWHALDTHRDDVARQMLLERIGWKFFRVRGGEYFRDPERALATLWRRLEDLGIRPPTEGPAIERTDLVSELLEAAARHRERLKTNGTTPAAAADAQEMPGPVVTRPAAEPSSGAEAIVDYLRRNPGWHGRQDIVVATGTEDEWSTTIQSLVAQGRVERRGVRRGTEYRIDADPGRQGPEPRGEPAPAPTSSAAAIETARRALIALRETSVRPAFPGSDPAHGLLRRSMLEAFLREQPTSEMEYRSRIPAVLRDNTDAEQLRFLPQVLEILRRHFTP
jgi:very-short-patch-repair endonuclease